MLDMQDELDMDFEDYGDEFVDDFDDFSDYEMLAEYDGYDDDYVDLEGDWEGYDELDPFFGKAFRKIGGFVKRAAKKLAPIAKAHAGKIGGLLGGVVGGPAGAALGSKIGGFVQNLEDADDYDSEDEMDAMAPVSVIDEGLAESMATAASKSRPADAQALGGAIAITITSKTPIEVKRVTPALASAAGRMAKSLASDPAAKPLVKTLPTIVKQTAGTLRKKAAKGKPVTPKTAIRVMAKQAKRTLASPKRLEKALANNAVKRRKLDKAAIAKAERFY